MEKGIYAIYDKRAEMFNDPFVAVNDLIAKRTFRTIVNDENAVNQYPKDFKLCKIAKMNVVTGKVFSDVKFEVEAVDIKEDLYNGKEV